MALPTTDITISLVKNTVGAPTYAITDIIGNAKSGGSAGEAFDANGYLIAGALPYWNIYSYNIPAIWIIEGVALKLRLEYVDSTPAYRLGDFRGYNHSALPPSLSVLEETYFSNGAGEIGFEINLEEWHLPDTITHIRVKCTIGETTNYELIPVGDINYTNNMISGYTIPFTSINSAYTSGTLWVYGSNSLGAELVALTTILYGSSSVALTIVHGTTKAYLLRAIDISIDFNVSLEAWIYSPNGDNDILISLNTTALTGVGIRVFATSATIQGFTFDLTLHQTNETDKALGNFSAGALSEGYLNSYLLSTITLNGAVDANDSLYFSISNLSY